MKLKFIFGLVLLALAASVASQVTDDTRGRPPAVTVEEKPRPVQQPKGEREVVIVSMALDFANGELQNARKLSSKRVNSVAPKVFLRKGGDWKVTINAQEKHSFFVNNPGWREAEPDASSGDSYEWIPTDGEIEWSLVVPLYKDGRSISARSLTISDTKTGRTLLEVDM